MKRIMFNDRYGLTQAVNDGRKTMTRRIIDDYDTQAALDELWEDDKLGGTDWNIILDKVARYKVGEVVAIAESYEALNKRGFQAPEWLDHTCEDSAGYHNKMFVRADLMPSGIEITGRRIERLRDISDDDCLKEGIIEEYHAPGARNFYYVPGVYVPGIGVKRVEDVHNTPQEAFAYLIDKVSKKPVWHQNPWCVAYSFINKVLL